MSPYDTIVAPITAAGPAAVAAVRLSGPEAFTIARRVFSPMENPEPMRARYGKFAHGDDGLALPFAQGHSYTGDETVELFLHGSPASVRLLIENCLSAGARMAEPGEFTQRAFLNGRIDLAQAEAVAETVSSFSARHLRRSNANLEGALSNEVKAVREQLLALLAEVEATVDFSEEIGELKVEPFLLKLSDLEFQLLDILARGRGSRMLREGFRVVLSGRPNAGKSSLLNALLNLDRAIVTSIPGTTRDTLEEAIEISGIQFRLTDTAGLRETNDPIEEIGIERSLFARDSGDLTLYLFDASVGWTEEDAQWFPSDDAWRVATKTDLTESFEPYAISVVTGAGIGELTDALVQEAESRLPDTYLISRHQALLHQILDHVSDCRESLEQALPPDLVSTLLRLAVARAGEITGETASADILQEIFSRFCIGK